MIKNFFDSLGLRALEIFSYSDPPVIMPLKTMLTESAFLADGYRVCKS